MDRGHGAAGGGGGVIIYLTLTWQGTSDEYDPANDWGISMQAALYVDNKTKGFLKRLRQQTYRDICRRGIQSLFEQRLG